MATIAEIAVNLTARTQKLEKDLARARGKLNKFGKTTQQSGSALSGWVKKAGAAAAGAFGLYKAIQGISGAMRDIDAAAKQGRSIGMTTQQVLQLQHSAQLAGVGASQLSTGLTRMTVGVQDAARGTGEARTALQGMGIDVQRLAAQSPHQQFMTIANAIAGITDPAKKADAAYKIFGRSGVDLINILDGGSEKLQQQAKDFDRLNGKISETDAKAIEDANDAIAEMKTAWRGVWVQVAKFLAPALKVISKILQGLLTIVNKVFNAIGKVVSGIWKVVSAPFKAVGRALGISGGTKKSTDAVNKNTEALKRNQAAMKRQEEAKRKQEAAAKKQAEAEKLLAQQREEQERKRQEILDAGQRITEQFRIPQEVFRDRLEELHKLVQAGAISWETYGRAVKGAVSDFKTANRRDTQAAAQPVGAVMHGTTAGFSAMQRAHRAQQRQIDLQRQENELQQQTNRILGDIRTNTQDQPKVAGV